jgi:hypothetical protein
MIISSGTCLRKAQTMRDPLAGLPPRYLRTPEAF